ncbi:MAG TPA: PilZ domain-containing protein [Polyangiaceae bacterium]
MRPVLHADCPRAQLRRPISTFCEVVRERDFRLVGSRVLDLSSRGLLVESDLQVLTGDEVLVTLRSPTTKRWYDCTGSVARVIHGRRKRDLRRAVAISFDGLDAFTELLLCEELRKLPVTTRHKQFAAFPKAR